MTILNKNYTKILGTDNVSTIDNTNSTQIDQIEVDMTTIETDLTSVQSSSAAHAAADGKSHSDVVLANTHRGLTNNPHSVTAAQVGAEPFNANIQSHISSTANPHTVTATQVGKDTAQWNADKLKGKTIDDAAIGSGKVLTYNLGLDKIEYITPNDISSTTTTTLPTDLKISTASKGGVFNGGFELAPTFTAATNASNWIDGTAAGSATDDRFGWDFYMGATAATAEFDSAVSFSGKNSLKIIGTTVSNGQYVQLGNVKGNGNPSSANIVKYGIPVKASTKYRITVRYKTNAITTANSKGLYGVIARYYSSGAFYGSSNTNILIAGLGAGYVTGTNDWKTIVNTFTTDSNDAYWMINFVLHSETGTAWIDELLIEEVVTNTTFTGKVAEKIRPVLQAVTSTDNIDQSQTTTGGTITLGTDGTSDYDYAQKFVPTKKYLTGITVNKAANNGTPAGNVVFQIVTDSAGPTTTILASKSYTPAQWNALSNGDNFIDLPCIVTAGTSYWLKIQDDASETKGSGYIAYGLSRRVSGGTGFLWFSTNGGAYTTLAGMDLYFIQKYAKKSESFSLIANGIKTELKADKDGMLSNSIIDLDNGKYVYDSGILGSATLSNVNAFCNNVYTASLGSDTGATIGLNGWGLAPAAGGIESNNGSRTNNDYLVLKINTILPIKHLKLNSKFGCYTAVAATLQISTDNINWTTLATQSAAMSGAPTNVLVETDLMNGLSTFYIKIDKANGVNGSLEVGQQAIEADLDTSSISQGLLYPIGTNQFTETGKLPSVATRIYLRLNKFTNEFGVVVPALEFTDASAVNIGYVPLKLDNSQETNPAVAIVKASTTNGQASGTGSDEGANYILNDGEYMTLSSAVSELSVVYLVGKGTTAFTNITKNTFYLSSNGESNDATQDPSHQGNFIVGARQQGLTDRVKDLSEDIEEIRKGIADNQELVRNNAFIIGFDAGTTDDYAITLANFKGYTTGMSVIFRANTANTTGATLNINGLGAKAIVKGVSTALSTSDILALMYCQCIYDGTNFVLLNPRTL